ncbi:hypothetical protein [Cohnella terricola]|uniref:YceG-like family protein n=1 Tax=Cohnella terricola TaxID=1289167 RepID=A0A559JCM9_9BACL|nr:hypothetical protein [Cohnella terricola]TVX97636.1 hypothetical protein FPZ45_17845 [Cohnella terricola]
MRKYRLWLMGLGVGLILGASMLQLILIGLKQSDISTISTRESLTAEELSDEARKAGLLLLTEDQLNARVEEAVNQATRKSEEEADGGTKESEAPKHIEAVGEQAVSGEKATSATPEEKEASIKEMPEKYEKPVKLDVKYGMSLTEVGKELKKLGVIDDVNDFIDKTRDVSKKMKVGTIVFTSKPTYKQIMNELTRKK